MSVPDPRCRHCGHEEHKHHAFVPMPEGCVCDPETWVVAVTSVCDAFELVHPDAVDECVCGHSEECHPGGA